MDIQDPRLAAEAPARAGRAPSAASALAGAKRKAAASKPSKPRKTSAAPKTRATRAAPQPRARKTPARKTPARKAPPAPAREAPAAKITLPGPAGQLEALYRHAVAPPNTLIDIALILHGHTRLGGTMNHPLVRALFDAFADHPADHSKNPQPPPPFSVLRFNFRGAGHSQGKPTADGQGELEDAAAALDWLRKRNPERRRVWVAGFSSGAWTGMQLMMRRPDIRDFISIAPLADEEEGTAAVPCDASGLILHGSADRLVSTASITRLIRQLRERNHIACERKTCAGANHTFENHLDFIAREARAYIAAHSHAD